MNKIQIAEFSLANIADEAKEFVIQASILHEKTIKEHEEQNTRIKQFKVEYMKLMGDLRKETKAANHALTMVEGHQLWKKAVRDLFGEDGLQSCFDYMKEMRVHAPPPSVKKA